ncbi:hypothetical protein SAMN00790413_03466 [Deinococcus hopiensis KR-140]|uniref:Uncharacterized protein n=1 Tax=Deinococcus hopiensis KR-140 TaxID=695939 RepID=A0A1W1UXX0_9DEIO|nr:hypothetical protein SAMN00790413_03466 [Deinococcus hopiensis KR-140]
MGVDLKQNQASLLPTLHPVLDACAAGTTLVVHSMLCIKANQYNQVGQKLRPAPFASDDRCAQQSTPAIAKGAVGADHIQFALP